MTDYNPEATINIGFTTRAFATGIPTVLAGTPVISAYEDAGLTQITAGITLGVDHDGVAGFNMITVVATAANGYDAGSDYTLVITTGTVGGVSVVGEVVGSFSLGRSASYARLGAPAGASVSADVAAVKAQTAAIETGTQDMQSRIPAALIGGRMDSDVEAINNDTDAADKLAAHALETLPVTFTGGTTTTAALGNVDGAAASSTDDVYIGRVLVFNVGTLNHHVAEITDYVGATKTATISAVTTAVTSSHTARMV